MPATSWPCRNASRHAAGEEPAARASSVQVPTHAYPGTGAQAGSGTATGSRAFSVALKRTWVPMSHWSAW